MQSPNPVRVGSASSAVPSTSYACAQPLTVYSSSAVAGTRNAASRPGSAATAPAAPTTPAASAASKFEWKGVATAAAASAAAEVGGSADKCNWSAIGALALIASTAAAASAPRVASTAPYAQPTSAQLSSMPTRSRAEPPRVAPARARARQLSVTSVHICSAAIRARAAGSTEQSPSRVIPPSTESTLSRARRSAALDARRARSCASVCTRVAR